MNNIQAKIEAFEEDETFIAYVGPGMDEPVIGKTWDEVKAKACAERERTSESVKAEMGQWEGFRFIDFTGY